jgi:hypothetical protein
MTRRVPRHVKDARLRRPITSREDGWGHAPTQPTQPDEMRELIAKWREAADEEGFDGRGRPGPST